MEMKLFTDRNIEAMVELANEACLTDHYFTPITARKIERDIYLQGAKPYDHIALIEENGRLIAFGGILTSNSMAQMRTMMLMGPYVSPMARGRGIGGSLVEWSLGKARNYPGFKIRTWIPEDRTIAHHLLAKFGFEQVGGVCFMRFSEYKQRRVFDASITVRSFREGEDEDNYLAVRNGAPTGYWGTKPLTRSDLEKHKKEYYFDPAGVLLAFKDGKPVGLLEAFMDWELTRLIGERRGDVHVFAIIPQYRGNLGLVLSLTNAADDYFSERQVASIEFPVDDEKVQLKKLYQRLGGIPGKVMRTYEGVTS